MQLNCPHCQSPIPPIDDSTDKAVCQACGSSFRLRDDVTETTAVEVRTLGKFQLLEKVGGGAFGAVWKARDTELGRTVAVKLLHASIAASGADRERFFREARSAAQLRHPGIVTVHEVTELDAGPAIVSDFVDGVTLRDLLGVRRLTFRESAQVVAQVADALDYAHSMKLVHRDVKPANIMVQFAGGESLFTSLDALDHGSATFGVSASAHQSSTYGSKPSGPRALLLDFGLALRDEAEMTLTADGQIIGTPAYMSPEQAAGEGHRVDRRSDIYALGVVLYELLAAELPFRGSKVAMLHQVMHEEPRMPRRINEKIPRDLETICLKAMAKSRASRYSTARELAEDLQRWLRDELIWARPVGNVERLWRWAKRNPGIAALGAAVLALIATVAISSTAAYLLVSEKKHAAELAREAEHRLAEENQRLAGAERKERERAEMALNERTHQLAVNYIQRGIALSESGRVATGVCWLLRGLDTASVDDPVRSSARNLMASWVNSAGLCLLHEAPIRAAGFSPDGKMAITGCDDKTARLWDVSTGDPLGAPLRHEGPVAAVGFSPDGKKVSTGSWDGTARLWDAATGEPDGAPLRHAGHVAAVGFSPDGKTLVTGSFDKTARLWDAVTHEQRGVLPHEDVVYAVAFSPDGRTVITGCRDKAVRLWDAETAEPRAVCLRHDGPVFGVAFSPDGKTVISGSSDKTARLWEVMTGEPRGTPLRHDGVVYAVAFSPDGKTVITGIGDNTAWLWDSGTGKPVGLMRHEGDVRAVGFSPDGKTVITGSFDKICRLWDTAANQPHLTLLPHEADLRAMCFSPDGKTVLTGAEDKTARLWDVATGEPRARPMHHDETVSAVGFSPDGKTLITGSFDNTAKLWEARTGEPCGKPFRHEGVVFAVAFSPDGKTVITGSYDRTARLWDAQTGEPRGVPLRHEDIVFAAAFSPDGSTVLTGSEDRTARLWDVETGEPRGAPLLHEDVVYAVAFSPDGKTIVTGCRDNEARLWDAQTGEPRGAPLRHEGHVVAVAFSPDGKTVITGSRDSRARSWDLETHEPRGSPAYHNGYVIAVGFSPDGRTALTGSLDKMVRSWDFSFEVPDEPERIQQWIAVHTGQIWDSNGVLRPLSFDEWLARRQRLSQLGGPPIPWRRN